MNELIKVRLHVLSPVHIGCDDVFEPTSFVIDETKKKLIEFDQMYFVETLNDQQRAEFLRVCSGDSILSIMKFIKNNCKNIKGREIDIVPELIQHYNKNVLALSSFDRKIVINQFTINKTAYNPQTNQPYIPGTSLKGSMRTAYLNLLVDEKQIKGYKGKSKELEIKLLDGKFETDPFRMVKVSDMVARGEVKTKIVYAVNKKKEKSDKTLLSERGGVYQIFETIQPGSTFEGTINIIQPEQKANIKSPITFDRLKASLNKFYNQILETERKTLESIGISVPLRNHIDAKFKGQIGKTVFLMRLGRHSGAEAVTIKDNRDIKIMQGKGKDPKYLDHATTLWLVSDSPRPKKNNLQQNNNFQPFGWVALEVIG